MKRMFLIMYVIGVNIACLLLLPIVYLITNFMFDSIFMIILVELWIKLLIEYRYATLQLTKSENGPGVEVMKIIDSILEDLYESICDIKEERELVRGV